MSESKFESVALIGEVRYASVHKARPNYSKTGTEFTVQVECTQAQLDKLKARGIDKRTKLRLDEETGKTFLNLMANGTKADGSPNSIPVLDATGAPTTELIGNGSKAKVLATLITTSSGKTLIRLSGIQVLELVKFESKPKTDNDRFNDADVI